MCSINCSEGCPECSPEDHQPEPKRLFIGSGEDVPPSPEELNLLIPLKEKETQDDYSFN